jgi:hypothetical protein
MFGRNLKRREKSRGLTDAFVGCLAGIRRLGKKIERRKMLKLLRKKWEILREAIFLPSLQIPAEQPTNASTRHLLFSRLFKFLPNIMGNEKNFKKVTLIH